MKKRKSKDEIEKENENSFDQKKYKRMINVEKENENEKSNTILMFETYFGINTPINIDESKKLCLEESVKGNLIAKGFKNFKGWECKKDYKKSFEYFKKSIESDEFTRYEKSYSMYMKAFFYENGNDMIQSINKAIKIYELASEYGNSMAMNNLGFFFFNGVANVKQDIPKALSYYEKAVVLGNSYAINFMADIYQIGSRVEENVPKAIEFYEKASYLGNTDAMYSLGLIYQKGQGVEKSLEKSVFYFIKRYSIEKDRLSLETLQQFFKKKPEIEWKMEYHPFWNASYLLNQQIVSLILIYKNRSQSKIKTVSHFFAKGICFNVVKYLCHFC